MKNNILHYFHIVATCIVTDNALLFGVSIFVVRSFSIIRGMLGYFYYATKLTNINCRGPPSIWSFKNFKLNGGKKDGRTPKKKKT